MSTFYQVLLDDLPYHWDGDDRCWWDNLRQVIDVIRDINDLNPKRIHIDEVAIFYGTGARTVQVHNVDDKVAEAIARKAMKDHHADVFADTPRTKIFGAFAYHVLPDFCEDLVKDRLDAIRDAA